MRIKVNVDRIKLESMKVGIWIKHHPLVPFNILGILLAFGLFFYFLTKPIDVLKDWVIVTTDQPTSGKMPVYHPNETLQFTSKSTKLVSTPGTATRLLDCDAVGKAEAREIQLDQLIANRSVGDLPARENSILVPDVVKFNGLPRVCRLVINVCYDNVILWRDWCETAKSNDFIVEESRLDPVKVQEQIDILKNQIKDLQKQLASVDTNTTTTTTNTNTVTVTEPQKETVKETPPVATPPRSEPAKPFLQQATDNLISLIHKLGL